MFPSLSLAKDGWVLSSFLGGAINFRSGIHFNMTDRPDFTKNAKWRNRAFEDSLYYMIRLEDWKGDHAWGVEWLHHKVYLANTDETIRDFSISDGYNILFFNRAQYQQDGWLKGSILRGGLGIVFGNPDVTLEGRDRFWNDGGIGGTYLSGIGAQVALERRLIENDRHFLSVESKLTVAYARIPISDDGEEYADVPNVALHFVFGFGSKPIPKEEPDVWDYTQYLFFPVFTNYVAHI